jgi:hypothetical protein
MEELSFNKEKYAFELNPSMLLIGDAVDINKQIVLFANELNAYDVLLKDLVNFPLKENDRNIALNIAYYICSNEELLEIMIQKKDLSIPGLSKLTGIKPEYLEKCRDYIITYCIILNNQSYKCLQDYFKIKLKEDNIISSANKNQCIHKGLVIKVFKKSAYILKPNGEFFKIKTKNKVNIGEIIEGKEKKIAREYRIHISIFLIILIFISCGIIIEYRRVQSTIVIETTSNIVIHVNKFNKVIDAYSPTERGKQLLDSIDISDKDIDEAVYDAFKYAYDNEMLDLNKGVPTLSRKTLITINGQAIKYGLFVKTNKFISENNIPVAINNVGNEQRLPKYSTDDEEKETKK